MSQPVDLSIIIVNYRVQELLFACLNSIMRVSRAKADSAVASRAFGPVANSATLEVIVVDNASRDDTVQQLAVRFPWVKVIANRENCGFTRGNNLGYVASKGDFVFFLNPDTEIVYPVTEDRRKDKIEAEEAQREDPLWLLYNRIRNDESIGAVGPQLRYGDNTQQNNRRRFPSRLTGFWESTWLGQCWPNNPWVQSTHMLDCPTEQEHDVDWLVGAALFVRRSALEAVRTADDVGPFDEGFFMYSEELDLCQRIKQRGWRILYLPQARVVHYEGRSSEQVVAHRHIYFNTSKVRYYRKYFGPVWAELLRQYLLLEFRSQILQENIKRVLGHKSELRTARIAAYRQVLKSGLVTS